ncbi:hypothetical protein COT97_00295 [Candidatus Falkowbacteria bacterium CG10_big_fil_rev_8_21_14_0_10_39_11]|uniref:Uncharacterized protein n=1 Tax=Candidatus Falkowbacteria bacterium CG10_big_fil_rev_8_21_14_0_10_39_11 TaxID=1974565 RepID=A0A2H0V633_9BACT|nr:MAG: hypothetical protein COT97_00295 [Candidatus Falkowbacteria bacterium CG10_big_fil_rev_8_21_14_0_10_39_11]
MGNFDSYSSKFLVQARYRLQVLYRRWCSADDIERALDWSDDDREQAKNALLDIKKIEAVLAHRRRLEEQEPIHECISAQG